MFPFLFMAISSANVSGIGDIIEPFEEEELPIKVMTPDIHCNTARVYSRFRDNFFQNINPNSGASLMLNNSYDILKSYYNSPEKLNDLYTPAVMECPKLKNYKKSGYFLSGSGSSFFYLT